MKPGGSLFGTTTYLWNDKSRKIQEATNYCKHNLCITN